MIAAAVLAAALVLPAADDDQPALTATQVEVTLAPGADTVVPLSRLASGAVGDLVLYADSVGVTGACTAEPADNWEAVKVTGSTDPCEVDVSVTDALTGASTSSSITVTVQVLAPTATPSAVVHADDAAGAPVTSSPSLPSTDAGRRRSDAPLALAWLALAVGSIITAAVHRRSGRGY